jgi:hypothetical protein
LVPAGDLPHRRRERRIRRQHEEAGAAGREQLVECAGRQRPVERRGAGTVLCFGDLGAQVGSCGTADDYVNRCLPTVVTTVT